MKKVIIMSDTHGDTDEMFRVISAERPFDILVHCGDVCDSASMIESRLADSIVHMVAGNCDYLGGLLQVKEFHIGRIKVVLTHGHRYHVDYGPDALFYLAKEKEADIVMYGHTHVPALIQEQGVTILNPGSLCRPRQADRKCTYVVMTVHDDGDFDVKFKTSSGNDYKVGNYEV